MSVVFFSRDSPLRSVLHASQRSVTSDLGSFSPCCASLPSTLSSSVCPPFCVIICLSLNTTLLAGPAETHVVIKPASLPLASIMASPKASVRALFSPPIVTFALAVSHAERCRCSKSFQMRFFLLSDLVWRLGQILCFFWLLTHNAASDIEWIAFTLSESFIWMHLLFPVPRLRSFRRAGTCLRTLLPHPTKCWGSSGRSRSALLRSSLCQHQAFSRCHEYLPMAPQPAQARMDSFLS